MYSDQVPLHASPTLAIYGRLVVVTSMDGHLFALDATTGEPVWDTRSVDGRLYVAEEISEPVVANGRVYRRSCDSLLDRASCVILAHDAATGAESWRTSLVPEPAPSDRLIWGDAPILGDIALGAAMPPTYDPELNRVYVSAPVRLTWAGFPLAGVQRTPLYRTCTFAIDGDTGDIVWYHERPNGHSGPDPQLAHVLVDTPVAPDPDFVSRISPLIDRGRVERVMIGIAGPSGVVSAFDRASGERLWNRPIQGIACSTSSADRDSRSAAYSPLLHALYTLVPASCGSLATAVSSENDPHRAAADSGRWRPAVLGHGARGAIEAISVETGRTLWRNAPPGVTASLLATGGGLVFGGSENGAFRAFDQATGGVLREINLGAPVSGVPITYAVDGRQHLAVATGEPLFSETPSLLDPVGTNTLFVFALDPVPGHPAGSGVRAGVSS